MTFAVFMPDCQIRQKVVHNLNNSGIIARPKTVIHLL